MELKSPALYPGIEEQVAEEFASFPGYVQSAVRAQRLVVQSFDWDSMARYHEVQPSVPVGLLGRPAEARLPELSTWADQINPNFRTYDAAYVDNVHQLGMEVHTYTVNRPEEYEPRPRPRSRRSDHQLPGRPRGRARRAAPRRGRSLGRTRQRIQGLCLALSLCGGGRI